MKAGILFGARDIRGVSSPGTRGYKSVKVTKTANILPPSQRPYRMGVPFRCPCDIKFLAQKIRNYYSLIENRLIAIRRDV
jgi:hypothetical protein